MTINLKPCPCCGGKGEITKGYTSTLDTWPQGTFYRVFCGACQLRQLFHASPKSAADAWNCRVQSSDNLDAVCTCPSGDGSLRWPCPRHPPLPVAITDKTGPNGIKWYVEPNLPYGINLYVKDSK